MKYLPFIASHLRHNWIRTVSTVLAMAICIFLFATLQTLVAAVSGNVKGPRAFRLITRHNVSLAFTMPNSYEAQIAAIPGVKRVSRQLVWRNARPRQAARLLPQLRHRG